MVYRSVRIGDNTHHQLRRLARTEGTSVHADLRADPRAWSDIEAERAEWDSTLLDVFLTAPAPGR